MGPPIPKSFETDSLSIQLAKQILHTKTVPHSTMAHIHKYLSIVKEIEEATA
jgi:hypothetical protein